MGKVTKVVENGISMGNAALLHELLNNCTNVPLADLDSFISYLELQDSLAELAANLKKNNLAILRSFKVEEENGIFSYGDHPERPKIEEALNANAKREVEVRGLKSLVITPLELAQITAGLKNSQRLFIKEYLVKK